MLRWGKNGKFGGAKIENFFGNFLTRRVVSRMEVYMNKAYEEVLEEVRQFGKSMNAIIAELKNQNDILRNKLSCIADGEFETKEAIEKWAREYLNTGQAPVSDYLKTISLKLNPYQAANLLWWLKRCWYWGPSQPKVFNSGDWVGEIPQILEKTMREAGGLFVTYQTNGSRDPFENPTYDKELGYVWPKETN